MAGQRKITELGADRRKWCHWLGAKNEPGKTGVLSRKLARWQRVQPGKVNKSLQVANLGLEIPTWPDNLTPAPGLTATDIHTSMYLHRTPQFYLLFYFYVFVFPDRVSLRGLGCPGVGWSSCESQRVTGRVGFVLALVWVLGIELRSWSLQANSFTH